MRGVSERMEFLWKCENLLGNTSRADKDINGTKV